MDLSPLSARSPWWHLALAARQAAGRAHAPFSRMQVGAAAITTDGTLFPGSNFESASYGLTLCAERAALAAAQQAGQLEAVRAIAITAQPVPGTEGVVPELIVPCGACRQWLFEAAARAGHDLTVVCVAGDFARAWVTTARALLPHGFAF